MKILTTLAGAPLGAYTAVALGAFDGLHIGHGRVICKALESRHEGLVPCVFTFRTQKDLPASKMGATRLISENAKNRLLEQMGVELLVSPDFEEFRHFTPEEFVEQVLYKKLGARKVCCGYNFHFGKGAAGDASTLRELCAKFLIDVLVQQPVMLDGMPVSSTGIRKEVKEGNMELAARMLGHPYFVDFVVEKGRQLGRTLGFPTINQRFPAGFAVPRFGVYTARAFWQGKSWPALTNVGVKPTVGSSEVLAETYLHGFSGDLYGQPVVVELHRFLRPEIKFDTLDELKECMQQDMQALMLETKAPF